MKFRIAVLFAALVLLVAVVPSFAGDEAEDCEKTKIVKKIVIGDGSECCEGADCEVMLLDCDSLDADGKKTVIIKMMGEDGECVEMNMSDLEMEMECLEKELGEKKVVIKMLGDNEECMKMKMGDIEMDMENLDEMLAECGVSINSDGEDGSCEIKMDCEGMGFLEGDMDISMVINKDSEEVTIKARGDKEKIRGEIDEMVEELKEDGDKVEIKEVDDGFDITIGSK